MTLADARIEEKKMAPGGKKTDTDSGKPWGNGKSTPDKKVSGGDTAKGGSTRVGAMTKGDGDKKAPPFGKKGPGKPMGKKK